MKLTVRRVLESQVDTDHVRAYLDTTDTDAAIVKRIEEDNGQYACLIGEIAVGGWRAILNEVIIGWMER